MAILNFSFVLSGKLAGMARPFNEGTPESDWRWLRGEGIGAIVNLTSAVHDDKLLRSSKLEYLQLPILDFTPPSLAQIERFVRFTDNCLRDNKGVAVHCAAGLGRTGTMLACYLVYSGQTAEEAITSVRTLRPGSIETVEQEESVRGYAEQQKNAGEEA